MPGPVFVEGDRVTLRTVEEEDVPFLQRGMNDPAVRRYAGGDEPYNRPRYEDEWFDRISATVVATNEASKRVVEKLGFTHEGTKRDDAFLDGAYHDREVYAVLQNEWRE